MQEKIAVQILKHTMGWSHENVTDNLADLQTLSDYGYDEYQQFIPGMRFIESLAIWLNQLPTDKRDAAFRFVKEKLLYITQDQMKQIISVAYPDHIVPILLRQASSKLVIPHWNVAQIRNSNEFKDLLRKCLFVGLSDGSQIDTFRRSNLEIDHEQVYRTHEINRQRTDKIKLELKKNLNSHQEPNIYFRNVFLLDDFSASGISYLKEKPTTHDMKGKIASFYYSIMNENDPASELVNTKDLRVWLILYIATEHAKTYLEDLGSKLFSEIPFSVIVIHTIPDSIKYREDNDTKFTELIKDEKYCSEKLRNRHMEEGDTTKLYLGFHSCALPLILNHNTPNNSLPILHQNYEDVEFKGLFPRINRHSD